MFASRRPSLIGRYCCALVAGALLTSCSDGPPADPKLEGLIVEGLTNGVLEMCADGPGSATGTITLRNPNAMTVKYSVLGNSINAHGTLGPNESIDVAISPLYATGEHATVSAAMEIRESEYSVRRFVAEGTFDVRVHFDVRVLRLVEVVRPAIGKSQGIIAVENPTSYEVPIEPVQNGSLRLVTTRVALRPTDRPAPGQPPFDSSPAVLWSNLVYELVPPPDAPLGDDTSAELVLEGERCSSKPLAEPAPLTLTGRYSDRATAIATGDAHTCAVGARGALYCWGSNELGQLGRAPLKLLESSVDARRVLPEGVTSVAAGAYHTCAVRAGQVSCWGANDAGQSDPSSPEMTATAPTPVALAIPAREVFARGATTCAVLEDRSVTCWGMDWTGALRVPPTLIDGLANIEQVVIGEEHRCARRQDGSVACWGKGGRVGDGTTVDHATPVDVFAGAKDLAARARHTFALGDGGVTFFWGFGDGVDHKTPIQHTPIGADPIERVFAAGDNYCYIDLDGAHCEYLGSLPKGGGLHETTAGDTSDHHFCVIHGGGKVACTGSNSREQLGETVLFEVRHGFD